MEALNIIANDSRKALEAHGYKPDEQLEDGDTLVLVYADTTVVIMKSDDGEKKVTMKVLAGYQPWTSDVRLNLLEGDGSDE